MAAVRAAAIAGLLLAAGADARSPKSRTRSSLSGNEVSSGTIVGDFKDNFGVTKAEYMPVFSKDAWTEIRSCSEWSEKKLAEQKDGTANYYSSTTSFEQFKGTDLVPENKDQYLRAPITGKLYYNNLNFNDARNVAPEIKMQSCSVPSQEDGWTWNIQRIGPFESHGNYDWWQVGWHDMGNLQGVLDKHPAGVIVDKHSMVPVADGTWARIGHPPIHIHHIHVMGDRRGKSVRQRHGFPDYNISLAAEQHGDYQCLEEDGGEDCYLESNPPGMGRLFTKALDIEGELNDVRAPRSDKLVWWYETAIRWSPKVAAMTNQVSMKFIVGPGQIDIFNQATYVQTYPTPTEAPTFYWYTGKMWTDGSLIRNKLHGHNSIFHSAYWINASPKELGLEDPKFMPEKTYKPQFIRDLGYDTIDSLATWVLDHLKSPANLKKAHPSRVICKGFVQGEIIDGFLFDRRAPCQCDEWDFRRGEDFTVISFSYHDGGPIGPHMPDVIPPTVPSHVHFVMQYLNKESGTSTFGMAAFTQTGEIANEQRRPGLYEKVLTTYNGGMLQKSTADVLQSWWFQTIMALFWATLLGAPILYCCRRTQKHRTPTERAIDSLAAEMVPLCAPEMPEDNKLH
jgi:hypothetical protein